MNGHTMNVSIEPGGLVYDIVCRELDGARCRQACIKGCEDDCENPDKHVRPVGHCLAAEWIVSDYPADCYRGKRRPLYDGMPITVDWDGDGWTWRPSRERSPRMSPASSVIQ